MGHVSSKKDQLGKEYVLPAIAGGKSHVTFWIWKLCRRKKEPLTGADAFNPRGKTREISRHFVPMKNAFGGRPLQFRLRRPERRLGSVLLAADNGLLDLLD